MIYIKDNFLDKKLLNSLNENFLFEFEEIQRPGCTIYAKRPPEEFVKYVEAKIANIEGQKIKTCLIGFRYSDKEKDTHWRIHADLYLDHTQKCKPERAGVIYMTEPPSGLTGTAFWKSKDTGLDNIDLNDIDSHNETLSKAEDLEAWELQTVVGHKKNRFLSYPCSYYHSKYPNITEESRIVCVIFYKYERTETK
jgi:hypothetical protein